MDVDETLVLTSVLQMGKGEEHESSFRGVIPLALDPVDCLDGEAYVSLIVKGPGSPLGGRRPPAAHTCGGDLKLFAQNKHQDVGSDCILEAPTCVLPSAAGIQDGVMAIERSLRYIYRRSKSPVQVATLRSPNDDRNPWTTGQQEREWRAKAAGKKRLHGNSEDGGQTTGLQKVVLHVTQKPAAYDPAVGEATTDPLDTWKHLNEYIPRAAFVH
ncbi:Protein F40F4.6 [Pontoporia blainvillei]|uniref:Protein F40F4.6 n=1 Tax=Pontoporia blainvillei TaxID=48723 RepID=A0ABX0S843_PONBL|nr:Protein F40F4.6 [Pontoporia blainvillei]